MDTKIKLVKRAPRRSVPLTKQELHTLRKMRSRFHTDIDFDETYGLTKGLVKRILLTGTASEQTVIRIRQILSDEQQ